jgi:hypothetical protein
MALSVSYVPKVAFRGVPGLSETLYAQIVRAARDTLVTIERYSGVRFKLHRQTAFLKAVKPLGFELVMCGGTCEGVLISKRDRLVIKANYTPATTAEEAMDERPVRAVPTILFHANGWPLWIQPQSFQVRKANSIDRASRYVNKRKESGSMSSPFGKYFGRDFHEGNIGIFRGQPVTFDW